MEFALFLGCLLFDFEVNKKAVASTSERSPMLIYKFHCTVWRVEFTKATAVPLGLALVSRNLFLSKLNGGTCPIWPAKQQSCELALESD